MNETIHRAAAIADVIEKARAACECHWTGYESDSGFDANHQIDLLDALSAALDRLDAAQGIVTEGQDPQGLGEREARVEPGPKDAPESSVIPVTTVKGETP